MQQKVLNNRYELEQKIGEGGMARVYRGRDLRLNRRVAMKILHSHYSNDPGFLGRFNHEAQAAANLRHPNIVDVYDVGQDGDIQYIVMEFVDGSDLKSLLRGGTPLPIDQAVTIAQAVAEGLDAAHRAGLVHRDIKPQNIIVGSQGQVKITDFGIAKSSLSTSATETGVIFGTADYLSPEQARGLSATPAADVYALGVSLYEMLTGRLPFTGDNSVAVAMQHISSEPTPPSRYNPRIPPQLENIVLSAMEKDPARRPASARAFAQMLRSYREMGDQGTVVRPVAPRPQPQQPNDTYAQQPQYQPPRTPARPRPSPSTGTTGSVRTPLPHRPAVAVDPPRSSGLGFGGFLLGLLLIAGVLGIIALFATGTLDGLFSFPSTNTRPTGVAVATAEPTVEPTALPQVPVPSLIGLTESEAVTALQNARLVGRREADRYADNIPSGQIAFQGPSAGTTITETSVVTYALSLGSELAEVPDVARIPGDLAQSRLTQAGFVVQVQEEASTAIDEGFVIRTTPSPGLRVPRGSTVTIIVSIGNKVVVPEVFRLSEAEARQRIEAAGLFVSYVDPQGRDKLGDQFDQFQPGAVVSTSPPAGTRVERGTGITLGIRAPE
jgi:serine/threonine-protein kinase